MTVDPLQAQLEQDIEDCISRLAELASNAVDAKRAAALAPSLRTRLLELCSALGRLGGNLQ